MQGLEKLWKFNSQPVKHSLCTQEMHDEPLVVSISLSLQMQILNNVYNQKQISSKISDNNVIIPYCV